MNLESLTPLGRTLSNIYVIALSNFVKLMDTVNLCTIFANLYFTLVSKSCVARLNLPSSTRFYFRMDTHPVSKRYNAKSRAIVKLANVADPLIHFWKLLQLPCFNVYRYKGHKNDNYKIDSCLNCKDTHILSGSEDGSVYIWDLIEVTSLIFVYLQMITFVFYVGLYFWVIIPVDTFCVIWVWHPWVHLYI